MKTQNRNYQYLEYTLPDQPTDVYIADAVKLLREIKKQFPEFYASFRCPSEVLTLSGVRAFDTYYELGEDIPRKKITDLKSLLKLYGVVLLEESFPFGNEVFADNRYSLVHIEAFNDIPNRYKKVIDLQWNQPDFSRLKNDTDFFLWWSLWQNAIFTNPNIDSTCKMWTKNCTSMAIHLTFGILLGYPGEAICSELYVSESDVKKHKYVTAKIQHAEKHDGAQPTYSFHRDVAQNPNIVAHQNLWSSILDGVYREL